MSAIPSELNGFQKPLHLLQCTCVRGPRVHIYVNRYKWAPEF